MSRTLTSPSVNDSASVEWKGLGVEEGGPALKQRSIATRIWLDEKIRECTWLEKWVFIHFQLRAEMTTIGAATVSIDSIEVYLNHEKGKRNRVTPTYPWILMKDIKKAIKELEKTGSVITQNRAVLTAYLPNFLNHNKWGRKVFMNFPELVRDQIPEGPIQEVIKQNTIGWMEEHRVEIPEGWRK